MKEGSDGVPSWWGSVSGAFAAFGDVEEEEKEEAAAKKQNNREENCARPPSRPRSRVLSSSLFFCLLSSLQFGWGSCLLSGREVINFFCFTAGER
jgi:hypothetical protein